MRTFNPENKIGNLFALLLILVWIGILLCVFSNQIIGMAPKESVEEKFLNEEYHYTRGYIDGLNWAKTRIDSVLDGS